MGRGQNRIDERGNRYGRLTVVEFGGRTERGALRWVCKCDCGGITVVEAGTLRKFGTLSCGCLRKESRSGEKNWNWCGGKSFEPYGKDFTDKLKESVRERDSHHCQVCGKTEEENNRALDVHHIDYDKKHNFIDNLISLCRVCHVATNSNREHWKERLAEMVGKI